MNDEQAPIVPPQEVEPNTAAPIFQPVVSPPEPKKPKKARHIVSKVLALLLLVLAIVAGYLVYLSNQPGEEIKTSTNITKQPPKTESKLAAEDVIAAIEKKLTGTVVESNATVPTFMPEGYAYQVPSANATGVSAKGEKDVVAADLLTITNYLEANEFDGTVHQKGGATEMYIAIFEADDVICGVTDTKPQPNEPRYATDIMCADKNSYNETAKDVKPFATAYAASTKAKTDELVFGRPQIKPSPTEGYEHATVSISGAGYIAAGGFAGLFYHAPDADWHYFKGVQSILDCSEYRTADLKKAFEGEPCYSGNITAPTTVKP